MKISVVIPLFNKRNTILRCIESVLNQITVPHEIIVVNDGSSDGSQEIVESLTFHNLIVFNQENQGVSAARNKGIELASGDWIAFLDADDIWNREYLKEINTLSEQFPECNVLCTSYRLLRHDGLIVPITLNSVPFQGIRGILSNYFQVASRSNPPIFSSAVVIHREAITQVGGFPLNITAGEDLLTWARLALRFKIGYSLLSLVTFVQGLEHRNERLPSRIPDKSDRVGKELIKLMNQSDSHSNHLRLYISHWYKIRSNLYLRLNLKRDCFRECLKSIKYNPFNFKVYVFFFMLLTPLNLNRIILKILSW